MNGNNEKLAFDESAAAEMVGKRVLIGITHLKSDGTVEKMRQLHGTIFSADAKQGIGVKLAGEGREIWLPAELQAFKAADPGEYRLRSTGEVVVDPDYLTTWTVPPPETD